MHIHKTISLVEDDTVADMHELLDKASVHGLSGQVDKHKELDKAIDYLVQEAFQMGLNEWDKE